MVWRNRNRPCLKDNDDGVASIEFAFISTVLAFMLMAIADVGLFLSDRADMRSAMHAGAYYFMMGGDDVAEAEATVKAAWGTLPEGTTISTSDFCECASVEWTCTSTCSDGGAPDVFQKIEIVTTYDGLLFDTSYKIDEEIRVR